METILGFAIDALKNGGILKLFVTIGQWLLILLTAVVLMEYWGYEDLHWEIKDLKTATILIWIVEIFKLLGLITISYLATSFIISLPEKIGALLIALTSFKAQKEITKKYPAFVKTAMRVYGLIRVEGKRILPGKRPYLLSAMMRDIALVDEEDKSNASPISYQFSGLFLFYSATALYLNANFETRLSVWFPLFMGLLSFFLSWGIHRISIWLFESENELKKVALLVTLKQWLTDYRIEQTEDSKIPENHNLEFSFEIKDSWMLSAMILAPNVEIRCEALIEEEKNFRAERATLLVVSTEPIRSVIQEYSIGLAPIIFVRHVTSKKELYDLIEGIREHLFLNAPFGQASDDWHYSKEEE